MTALPPPGPVRLGLVIDLDICVGCHACAVSCKEWNSTGASSLGDVGGAEPWGTWANRVHSYQVGADALVHFPKSCLHCADAPCVTVCPTGASYKRAADGIVLVNEDACMGCGLCAWACPYGARELDAQSGVMKKCTLCVDRIHDDRLDPAERVPVCVRACPTGARAFGDLGDPDSAVSRSVAARGGFDLMPEQATRPTNKYLPPRDRGRAVPEGPGAPEPAPTGLWSLLDRAMGVWG